MPEIYFSRNNLDNYLRELGKEFRKINGPKSTAEIILIGGASVLLNYEFRKSTYDVDAIIQTTSNLKEAINRTGDKFGLPNGWLNADFIKTSSYSPKLIEHSVYYKTFSNVLKVRTVSARYLIAMKLMAGRQYKNDLSDVVGIIITHQRQNRSISLAEIKSAVTELYGRYDCLPNNSKTFIEAVYQAEDLAALYNQIQTDEVLNKNSLLEFQENYPNVLNENNLNNILTSIQSKKNL